MVKVFKIFISLLLIFQMISIPAWAGDYAKKGQVLDEDSYVFSIQEATDLMNRIYQLEQENEKQKKLLEQYQSLDGVQQKESLNYEELVKTKELQILEYQKLNQINEERIKKLDRQANSAKIEKWAFLGLGIGLTVGSILIADKIDDEIDASRNNSNISGLTLFRF